MAKWHRHKTIDSVHPARNTHPEPGDHHTPANIIREWPNAEAADADTEYGIRVSLGTSSGTPAPAPTPTNGDQDDDGRTPTQDVFGFDVPDPEDWVFVKYIEDKESGKRFGILSNGSIRDLTPEKRRDPDATIRPKGPPQEVIAGNTSIWVQPMTGGAAPIVHREDRAKAPLDEGDIEKIDEFNYPGQGKLQFFRVGDEVTSKWIPEAEDRLPGGFDDMAALNAFKAENPEYADYEGIRDPKEGKVFLHPPKEKADIPSGRWGTKGEADRAKASLGLTDHTSTYDPQSGLFFLQPPEAAPFGLGETVEAAGRKWLEVSPGKFQDVTPDAPFELGELTRRGDRLYLETGPGSFEDVTPEPTYERGVVQDAGYNLLQQGEGGLEYLPRQFDPGIVSAGDMYGVEQRLLQQQTGAVSQIAPPTMDQIITQALVDGDFDKAMAFQDFANRPTAMEAFQAAVAFARSPADQQLISSIARGETPVAPPPPGTVQRIGPAPDFLVREYNTFQQRLKAGRPPTAAEQQQFTQRYQEGRSPLTDELEQQNAQMQAASTQQQANFELRMTKLETQRATEQGKFQAAMEKSAQKLAESNRKRAESDRKLAEALAAPPLRQQQDTTTDVVSDTRIPDGDRDYQGDKPHAAPTGVPWTDARGNTKNISIGQWVANEASRLGITRDISHGSDLGLMTKKGAVEFNRVLGRGGSMKEALDAVTAGLRSDELLSPQTIINRDQRIMDQQRRDQQAATTTVDTPVTPTGGVNNRSMYDPMSRVEDDPTQKTEGIPEINASPVSMDINQVDTGITPSNTPIPDEQASIYGRYDVDEFAKGGLTQGNNLEIVGEEGPELVDLPPGTFVLPIKGLNQAEVARAKANGTRGYQNGGIVFQQLPLGLRQLQSGRAISQPRGYLSRAAGLTLPSAQAFQNITPESREVFMDLASLAGIPPKSFEQELRLPIPGGRRQPTARILPLSRRGIR